MKTGSGRLAIYRNQRGALLIALIIIMVIMGILGGAMLYTFSSSKFDPVFGNFAQRAYYAAESGMRFALAVYRNDSVNGLNNFYAMDGKTLTFPDNQSQAYLEIRNPITGAAGSATTQHTANITAVSATNLTVTVDNVTDWPTQSGFFQVPGITGYYRYKRITGTTLELVTGPSFIPLTVGKTITSPEGQVAIKAKGYFPLNGLFGMSRTVEYGWIISGGAGGNPLAPRTLNPEDLVANNPFGNSTDLGRWEAVNVEGGQALHVAQTTGGNAEAVIGFSASPNPLATAWASAGQFLSYDVQVKIATMNSSGGTTGLPLGYVAGISFRSKGTNPGLWDQYGLSFARWDSNSNIFDTLNPTGIYPAWSSTGTYTQDMKVAYNNTYYRCNAASCPPDNKGNFDTKSGNWVQYNPPMILLWTRNSNQHSGYDNWMAYKLLTDEPSDGILDSAGFLKKWSTLLLRIVEGASLRFNSTSTGFAVGDTVTGATSGATGKVFKKIKTTAGNDVIILNNLSGTFQTGENISSPNQTAISNVEWRPRDNYIWAMFGDTADHPTADTTALNDTRLANVRVLDDSVINSNNMGYYIHWPENDINNWGADITNPNPDGTPQSTPVKNDYYKLSAWNTNLNLNAVGDPNMLIMGYGKEQGAIIRTNKWVTDWYGTGFPYDLGWHSLGDMAVYSYFDDLAINFPGQTGTGIPFVTPIQQ